jgi:hypothetical protein
MEVCISPAHYEGIDVRQPHNKRKFLLLLAKSTRSIHGRVGATGLVRHKQTRCNLETDQIERHLTAPQNFATSADLVIDLSWRENRAGSGLKSCMHVDCKNFQDTYRSQEESSQAYILTEVNLLHNII